MDDTHENAGPPDRLVLQFIAGGDAACPVCDYELAGLTEPACPECGAELSLHLTSPRQNVGPWALAIVSFALALGFDGVVALMLVVAIALEPTPPPPGLFVVVAGFLALAGGMLSGVVLVGRSRSRWARRPLARQWVHAAAIFMSVGVLHTLIGASLFFGARL